MDEWVERFDREGVWWAPAQTPVDVVADPQLIANDGFVDGVEFRSVNGPVNFSSVDPPAGRSVPALGEHTEEVLKELADQ